MHRIGRTGRAGNKGFAVTFLSPGEDAGKASGIVQAELRADGEKHRKTVMEDLGKKYLFEMSVRKCQEEMLRSLDSCG